MFNDTDFDNSDDLVFIDQEPASVPPNSPAARHIEAHTDGLSIGRLTIDGLSTDVQPQPQTVKEECVSADNLSVVDHPPVETLVTDTMIRLPCQLPSQPDTILKSILKTPSGSDSRLHKRSKSLSGRIFDSCFPLSPKVFDDNLQVKDDFSCGLTDNSHTQFVLYVDDEFIAYVPTEQEAVDALYRLAKEYTKDYYDHNVFYHRTADNTLNVYIKNKNFIVSYDRLLYTISYHPIYRLHAKVN